MEPSPRHGGVPPSTLHDRPSPKFTDARASRMIAGCSSLPSLPAAYLRLLEAMNNPYSSADDFARVIEHDPALTARVLRVVNSPLIRLSTPIDTMTMAMSVLGVGHLHDLVLATSAIDVFNNVPADLIDMNSFWRHSLGTAVACRVIGVESGHPDADKLFITGLLHDIGRLVMCLAEPILMRDLMQRASETGDLLVDLERDVLGFDHADVGFELLAGWGLPGSLTEPVACHHQPQRSRHYQREVAILHVADITAHALFFGSSGERLIPPLSSFAWSLVEWDSSSSRTLSDVDIQFQVAQQVVLR